MSDRTVTVVIPVFNEAPNILPLCQRIRRSFGPNSRFEIFFVDDGSTDQTLEHIKSAAAEDDRVRYVSFSRNFGHQAALKAGLDFAKSDCVITLDGDLQHPPELIPDMLAKWREGHDVVYTKRIDDHSTGLFKKYSSLLYYSLINRFSDFRIEPGTADFRLLDRKVVELLKNWNEHGLFWRGVVPWLGFKRHCLEYRPEKRVAGDSKYTLKRMARFSVYGIIATSLKPLRFSIFIGLLFATIAGVYATYAVGLKIFYAEVVPGWTSIITSIMLIGGIQLIMLGIIGLYIGQILVEVRGRPIYIVKEDNVSRNGGPD